MVFKKPLDGTKPKSRDGLSVVPVLFVTMVLDPVKPGVNDTTLLETCPLVTPMPLSLLSTLLFGVVVSAFTSAVLAYPEGGVTFTI